MESTNTIFSNIFGVMILFQKIDKHKYPKYANELKNLYLRAFTKGLSAQYISDEEAKNYLNEIFKHGYGVFGFVNETLVAAILSTPLSFDDQCPEHLKKKFDDSNSVYITEVIVDENYQGQGYGKKLMKAYEDIIDNNILHILLRVWDKNKAAVGLYHKAGFDACGNITQTKLKPISKEPFKMNKIYMVKSYQI